MSDESILIKLENGTNLRHDLIGGWFELWWHNQFAICLSLKDVNEIHKAAHAFAHKEKEKENV